MAKKATEASSELRRALAPPSARRRVERPQPLGRYDGRQAPLPPGDQLAVTPAEETRKTIKREIGRLRVAIHRSQAQERKTVEADKREALAKARARLEAEVARLGKVIAVMRDDVAVAGVDDPMGDGKQLIRVKVNTAVDILEQERSRKRISEDAYRAGHIIQTAFEHASRVGGANWLGASRKDPAEVRDTYAQRLIDDAHRAEALLGRLRRRVGMVDARLLRRIVGEGRSFADCAALIGRAGPMGEAYITSRFRDAVEDAVHCFEAKARALPTPADRYAAAAAAADERQDLSIIGGATQARFVDELDYLEGGGEIAPGENRGARIAKAKQRICDQRLGRAMVHARRASPRR